MGKRQRGSYLATAAAVIILNVVAWSNAAFCDWYISHIFPLWVNTYGRITGLFPFSIGEFMLLAGVLLLVGAILSAFWVLGTFLARKHCSLWNRSRKAAGAFFCVFAWVVLGASVVMTLNCTILYHASPFSEKYFGDCDEKQYSLEELVRVRNFVVEQCNTLSREMERDASGRIVYDRDMQQVAIDSMRTLGETYGGLSGYYPRLKPLFMSDFFSQQYMAGYYFPFSMEANYNDVMYIMNKPATFCHELAHLKGYIYEDEANFIGYLACIQSDDIVFQYSGYLSVLYYLDNDFYDAVGESRERYMAQEAILPQVHEDNIFLTPEEWDRVETKAVLDTETVDAVSDSFTNTTLMLNGVADGMQSYSRVVKLLLQYYQI